MYADKALQAQHADTVRKVRKHTQSLVRFLYRRGLLTEAQSQKLCHARSFSLFSSIIRTHLVAQLSKPGNTSVAVNSQAYWHVIDACGFVEDATPGRWPYNGPSDWKRSLDWAMQECDALRTELARQCRPVLAA